MDTTSADTFEPMSVDGDSDDSQGNGPMDITLPDDTPYTCCVTALPLDLYSAC